MTPEGKIKRKVSQRLNEIPRHWRFMPVQTGYGMPALDYLLCVGGWFVSIETKAKGKKLTARQAYTKDLIEAAGGLVFVVDDDESLDYCMRTLEVLGGP